MSAAEVVLAVVAGIALWGLLETRSRVRDLDAKIAACRLICPAQRVPVVVGELQRAPDPVCTAAPSVPAGWESWCPGAPGTECRTWWDAEGRTGFEVTIA